MTTSADQASSDAARFRDDDLRAARDIHLEWLLDLTSTPTAAGHEHRVIAWIMNWVAERPSLSLSVDVVGNLSITRPDFEDPGDDAVPPLIIQAHLDHPAFVVEGQDDDGSLDLTFRGGVKDPYFVDGRIRVLVVDDSGDETVHEGRLTASDAVKPLRRARAELDSPAPIPSGSVAVWDLPAASLDDEGIVHAPAIDDLAGVAAALSAYDIMLSRDVERDVRLFFTRAEEVGFVGTIGACNNQSLPLGSDVLTLETSRSFADSPIGGGPIVRVGDRVSTFDPRLTGVAAHIAAAIQKHDPAYKWQRKLMAGGMCEATVYARTGYAATCVCLPLGNYHNMADLAEVETGHPASASIAPEFIALEDYYGLVRLLVACAETTPGEDPVMDAIQRRYATLSWVVGGDQQEGMDV